MNSNIERFVVFTLDGNRYALSLSSVQRIVRVVEITPLPAVPEIVIGIINVQGKIIPVVDARKRFGLPQRALSITDQLILAETPRRIVALLVDDVSGVIEIPGDKVVGTAAILSSIEHVDGVIKLDDDLALIHDIDRFLSIDEEERLCKAIDRREERQ